MMDVAKGQGKTIDAQAIGKSLGIPVLPFVAADKKGYADFYALLERAEKERRMLNAEALTSLSAGYVIPCDDLLLGVGRQTVGSGQVHYRVGASAVTECPDV